jgi:hypothetical protein
LQISEDTTHRLSSNDPIKVGIFSYLE